ncbi:MAG: (deoxy)nucleoside triphosphate pyrophosphohydrolase [Desulfobacteraceae bacterium]|jgi:8-oxo-dGTP diphosphatase
MVTVTAAIISDNGKVFIAKRKPPTKFANLWEFPGGKVEDGETPEQCLKRELLEEFEIDVAVGKHLGTSEHEYDFGAIELMAYATKIVGGEMKLNDHAEVAWVKAEDLTRYEFVPADLPFVEMIGRGEIEL